MARAGQPPEDDLLRRAQAMRDRAVRSGGKGAPSMVEEFLERNRTAAAVLAFLRDLKRWTGPLGRVVAWLLGRFAAYLKFAAFRRRDGGFVRDEDGGLDFSLARLCAVLALSAVGLLALHVALSAAYFYGTYFHEMVYVTGKQEIETGELYQFGGCTSLPCSTETDNGKFYLIESSLYFPVMFYPEENVFANIPQQNGACAVEGYGIYFRSLRWLYKSAQLYQHVVDVSCRPYTEDEIRRSVESGQILSDREGSR
jgi:hypothetical protein